MLIKKRTPKLKNTKRPVPKHWGTTVVHELVSGREASIAKHRDALNVKLTAMAIYLSASCQLCFHGNLTTKLRAYPKETGYFGSGVVMERPLAYPTFIIFFGCSPIVPNNRIRASPIHNIFMFFSTFRGISREGFS